MDDKPMTLEEAHLRTGVSIVTLRRAIKEGRLLHLHRRNDRLPYMVLERHLVAAGYTVLSATDGTWVRGRKPTSGASGSDLGAVCEELRLQLAACEVRCERLEDRNDNLIATISKLAG